MLGGQFLTRMFFRIEKRYQVYAVIILTVVIAGVLGYGLITKQDKINHVLRTMLFKTLSDDDPAWHLTVFYKFHYLVKSRLASGNEILECVTVMHTLTYVDCAVGSGFYEAGRIAGSEGI